jgi:hypothetical protein
VTLADIGYSVVFLVSKDFQIIWLF